MENSIFDRTIEIPLGKIQLDGYTQNKSCLVVLEISLYSGKNSHRASGEEYFSVCATFYNSRKTDAYICGQCLDKVEKRIDNGLSHKYKKPFKRLAEIHEQYHLHYTKNIPLGIIQEIKELIIELQNISLQEAFNF